LKKYSDIDSKFRFVILAAKRAKQLLRGDKPKIKSKSKNPVRIAQNELVQGLIEYDIIQSKEEGAAEPEEQSFIGEEVEEEIKADVREKAKKKVKKKTDKEVKKKVKKKEDKKVKKKAKKKEA